MEQTKKGKDNRQTRDRLTCSSTPSPHTALAASMNSDTSSSYACPCVSVDVPCLGVSRSVGQCDRVGIGIEPTRCYDNEYLRAVALLPQPDVRRVRQQLLVVGARVQQHPLFLTKKSRS